MIRLGIALIFLSIVLVVVGNIRLHTVPADTDPKEFFQDSTGRSFRVPPVVTIKGHEYFVTGSYGAYYSLAHCGHCSGCQGEKP